MNKPPRSANMQDHSDEELMGLYQKGDETAFQEIYRRHSKRVYGYLRTRLRGQPEVVDEVFQNVFLKMHRSRSQYDNRFSVLQWLYVISKTSLIDYMRRSENQAKIASNLGEHQEFESDAGHPAGADQNELLKSLSEEQVKVVKLRTFDEATYEEIASQLGRSEQAVRQIFSRAVRKMRLAILKRKVEGN